MWVAGGAVGEGLVSTAVRRGGLRGGLLGMFVVHCDTRFLQMREGDLFKDLDSM